MFTQSTHDIKVTAVPQFLRHQSQPEENRFCWAYTITIENYSDRAVQLVNRHWKIIDAEGRMTEVRGPGVVGETPLLQPGEAFRYSSGTALDAASGIMHGSYEMTDAAGNRFDIAIPAFSLDSPYQRVTVN